MKTGSQIAGQERKEGVVKEGENREAALRFI